MERTMGLFGIADFVVKNSRKHVTFLDGVQAMINCQRIEKLLKWTLGRKDENTAGVKAYPAPLMLKILLLRQWHGLGSVVKRRIFILYQGKNAFYGGSVLFSYSTGIKIFFDAAGGQKSSFDDTISNNSGDH